MPLLNFIFQDGHSSYQCRGGISVRGHFVNEDLSDTFLKTQMYVDDTAGYPTIRVKLVLSNEIL